MSALAQSLDKRNIRKPLRWTRYLLVGLVLLYVGLLILTPLGALLYGTFQNGMGKAMLQLLKPDVMNAFLLTLTISLIVVAVHAVFGTIVAWVIVRHKFPGRNLLNSLIDIPFAISPVVVGYILLLIFGRNGMLAPLLAQLNIQVAFAYPGMVLATLFVTLPFMIRELIPVMKTLDREQEKAAQTLGATRWQIFWRVTLPSLRWGILYGITLTFARALGEFGAILVIGGGIQNRTETATVFIYRALEDREYFGAYIAALLLGVLSLSVVYMSTLGRANQKAINLES